MRMGMVWPNHGGQPSEIKRKFKIDEGNMVIDFSANIHPFGPPEWMKQVITDNFDLISRYPDPAYTEASSHLAKFDGVHKDEVLLTNGGAEAIFLTAKFFEGKKALIVQPTFSEYERACRNYHLDVEHVFLHKEDDFKLPLNKILDRLPWADVIYICRPNNPTGTVVKETDIRLLLDQAKKTGTFLVVDEAFVDFLADGYRNLVPLLQEYHQLILLRSLTKMYAIPGIRVGYILANQAIIQSIKQWRIPWSVNAFAQAVIPMIVDDQTYVTKSQRFFDHELTRIREGLTKMNFYMSPSAVNFYLIRDNENPDVTGELFEFLLHRGVLARHTDNFKQLAGDYLRFAVRSEKDNDLLMDVLSKWRKRR